MSPFGCPADDERAGKDECAAGNGYRFASTECPIATITAADIALIVTRLWPGYFALCSPIGWHRAGPMSGKVVDPRPVPDGTLAAVGYRVLSRGEWDAPLTTGVRDPAFDEHAGSHFSTDLPTGDAGKVVDDRNERMDVYVSDSITYKGVIMDYPGVNSATGPNGRIGTRASRVPADMVEKVMPLPMLVFV